jgi:hypothetical protein
MINPSSLIENRSSLNPSIPAIPQSLNPSILNPAIKSLNR